MIETPMHVESWEFEEGEPDDTGFPNPDTVIVHFKDDQGETCTVRFSGDRLYPSEQGEDHDLIIPLAEDFLDEFAARLGYRVDKT